MTVRSAPTSLQRLAWLLPLLVTVAVYLPSVRATGWILDDTVNLAQHASHGDLLGEWLHDTYGHAGGGAGHIWRPVPASLQHLVALASGRTPPVFRLLNLLLHLGCVALVYRLARALAAPAGAASLLALFFALHPALPEAVCWSSDIYDLALGGSLLGLTWLLVSVPGAGARHAGTFALLLLACLCKETALAFAPVVALAALLWRGWRDALVATTVSAAAVGTYLLAHGAVTSQGYGAAGVQSPLGQQLAAWLSTSGWLLWAPHRAPLTHLFEPGAVAGPMQGAATLVLLVLLTVIVWRRDARAGRALAIATGAWACLLAPTGPAIPLVGLHSFRYVYAPLALVAALAAPALAMLGGRRSTWAAAGAAVAWCCVTTPRVVPRALAWADPDPLFEAELALEPDNAYAKAQLARTRVLRMVEVDASLELWASALAGPTPSTRLFDPFAERWDLAKAAFLSGRPAFALAQVERLLADCERSGRAPPDQAWCLAADSLDALGRPDEAAAVAPRCPGSG